MIGEILIAWCLVAVTVTIHAAGLGLLMNWVLKLKHRVEVNYWTITRSLTRLAWCLILLAMLEVTMWAVLYWLRGSLPDFETSLYFSGVTYSTIGYGDIVLPKDSRLIGPIEGLTGILMCGLSTGFFFAVVARMFGVYKTTLDQ